MLKKTNTKTKITKTILLSSIIAVIILILTPLFFVYELESSSLKSIWGFNAIFGLQSSQMIQSVNPIYSFTWVLYVALLLFLVLGFTTYYIGTKSRGYYIFSAIIYVIVAIIIFNSKAWVINEAFSGTKSIITNTHLGIGAWFAGLVASLNVILCIIEFKTFKSR